LSASSHAPLLETRGLSVRFGGEIAVNAVSCAFQRGTLTALVGPNGAGKTTYFNLISGQLRASAGSVWLAGRDITAETAPARARRGLGRGFQLTQLFPALPVLENLRLAVARRVGVGLDCLSLARRQSEIGARCWHHLEQVGLTAQAAQPAAALSHGDQRKLEVAMLLALEPMVFLFDEPTAGMSVDDMPVMLDLLAGIRAMGGTILLVEHKMDVVRRLADRVIVLHQGALIAEGTPAEAEASSVVQQAYLGRLAR